MAHEFVLVAQTFRIEDDVVVDRHGIVERGAEREARFPELPDVADETEGARAREFAAEGRRIDRESAALAADRRRL